MAIPAPTAKLNAADVIDIIMIVNEKKKKLPASSFKPVTSQQRVCTCRHINTNRYVHVYFTGRFRKVCKLWIMAIAFYVRIDLRILFLVLEYDIFVAAAHPGANKTHQP